jgi:misacylated tRNA(Ala) deacylase
MSFIGENSRYNKRMTEPIFQTNSYIQEFDAVVVQTHPEENTVVLDRTAFYAGGGGQPNDTGILRWDEIACPVVKVRWGSGEIWHTLQGADLPAVGSKVRGEIDWQRRYQLMRTHTALHILCGVVFRDYGALVTGGNMEPLAGRMDFEFESLRAELVHEIEASVNREVQAAHDVRVRILPRAEAFQIPDLIRTKINLLPDSLQEIRTVEIVGLDLQADGGTHVANTFEVGMVHIAGYESKGKINKRIRIQLDA